MPTAPNRAYKPADAGDVQSVLAFDCAGGAKLDLIAGTKSTSAGYGTIEVWRSDDASSPAVPARSSTTSTTSAASGRKSSPRARAEDSAST